MTESLEGVQTVATERDGPRNPIFAGVRRFLIRFFVVVFLVAPALLILSGGAFGQIDLLAVSVIVLGLWYAVPLARRRNPSSTENPST